MWNATLHPPRVLNNMSKNQKNTPGWHKGTADGDIQKDRDVKKMFIGMFYFCYKQKETLYHRYNWD